MQSSIRHTLRDLIVTWDGGKEEEERERKRDSYVTSYNKSLWTQILLRSSFYLFLSHSSNKLHLLQYFQQKSSVCSCSVSRSIHQHRYHPPHPTLPPPPHQVEERGEGGIAHPLLAVALSVADLAVLKQPCPGHRR